MNVYFDTSCLSRPFDDPSIARNDAETKAILAMLEMVERGELSLSISDIVLQEIATTPQGLRRQQLSDAAQVANTVIRITDEIRERGMDLQGRGFKSFDALHVAAAESARVDRLCTADDRLRKRAARQTDLSVRVVSILELSKELQL